MENQNWDPIIFNGKVVDNKKLSKEGQTLGQTSAEVKIEAPNKIGQLISQARSAKGKNQKQLATSLGIAVSVLARWETEKELPSNAEIAKIEKCLGVKLPRSKKIKIKD